jgi:protein gp37
MGDTTKISWADKTFNPWIGCEAISPGCEHCYAHALVKRWGGDFSQRTRTSPANWLKPRAWNRRAERLGRTYRVFCASLADVFDNQVPDEWRRDLFTLIADTPALTWMLLTKRVGNVERMAPVSWMLEVWPKNVWLGITVVNQEEADRDIPKLLAIPAHLRWLSCEPLLGPIDLRDPLNDFGEPRYCYMDRELKSRIEWVIVGGESGHHARPFVLGWAKDVIEQCQAHGAAVHVKQLGANPTNREGDPHLLCDRAGRDPTEWPQVLRVQAFPDVTRHDA